MQECEIDRLTASTNEALQAFSHSVKSEDIFCITKNFLKHEEKSSVRCHVQPERRSRQVGYDDIACRVLGYNIVDCNNMIVIAFILAVYKYYYEA